jgi:hypothetical protein
VINNTLTIDIGYTWHDFFRRAPAPTIHSISLYADQSIPHAPPTHPLMYIKNRSISLSISSRREGLHIFRLFRPTTERA